MTACTDGTKQFQELAAYAVQQDIRALPEEILDMAKSCLLYGLAVGVATAMVWQAAAICRLVDADGAPGDPTAIRLLDGRAATLSGAAMANAVLLSGRVQGDSHPAGHLGGVVIPTALALGQHRRLSGAAVLGSMVAGYETALRIGRDHAAALTSRGFRTTPCYGVFAAAAAAGRALGLEARQMMSALSLASNMASGLREYVNAGTEESPFQAGFASRAGIAAALLAMDPAVVAAPTALHGEAGFFSAYGGADSDHGARLSSALGQDFELTRVTYKPFPACQFLRGLIRLMLTLRSQAGGAGVESITVRLHPFEADFVGVRYTGPFGSPSQTVMSAPFCAALAWATGMVGYAGLREYDNPDVLAIVPRVRIVSDTSCARYTTKVRVALVSGPCLEAEDIGSDRDFALDWPTATRMAHELCREVGVEAGGLIEAVETVENAPDIDPLIAAATQATQAARSI